LFVLLLLIGVVITFALLLTRQDPMPYVRSMAYYAGLGQLVEFERAIPINLAENMKVAKVEREDTDVDGFDEWLVFYNFDTGTAKSPIEGIVYDNDRGNPAIIFPYALRVPDRNYLSEDPATLHVSVEEIAQDQNGQDAQNSKDPEEANVPEIVVDGEKVLSVFRFEQNTQWGQSPTDEPARYPTLGYFRGDGGVILEQSRAICLDDTSEQYRVQVTDPGGPGGYGRSQLAERSIYALNWQVDDQGHQYQTFLATPSLDPDSLPQVAPPVLSTVDFFPAPPTDIFNTPYPEKIVLGFYASTCGSQDESLCNNYNSDWKPESFLSADPSVPGNEAYGNRSNPAYFGLPGMQGNQCIIIRNIAHSPQVEVTNSQPTLTGLQPQQSEVEVTFNVGKGPQQTIHYKMVYVNGQWKILQALSQPPQESSSQISSTQ
jgi:hypothetical protein